MATYTINKFKYDGNIYNIQNDNTIGQYGGGCVAGTNGMAQYSLIMQTNEDTWESLVKESNINTTKTKNTNGFLLDSPILYQNGNTYTSGQTAPYGACWISKNIVDVRYSTNGGSFGTSGKPFYLVGTINTSDNKFYLSDTWWSLTLPTSQDGKVYIYLGQFYGTYSFSLAAHHPKFVYIKNKIINFDAASSIKMDKEVSLSSISVAPGDIATYTVSTGNGLTNYQIANVTNIRTNGYGQLVSLNPVVSAVSSSNPIINFIFHNFGSSSLSFTKIYYIINYIRRDLVF